MMDDTCSPGHVCLSGKGEKEKVPLIPGDVLEKALRHVFDENFDPEKEIEEELFYHTLGTLNEAVDKGIGTVKHDHPDREFKEQLKYNNAVFAAFKTHRQQNDLVKLLVDEDGNPKSFARFKKDTGSIIGNYDVNWLQAEYSTAVKRARQAARDRQMEREADVYPNVRWMPSTAAIPREAHVAFYHEVWEMNDPFIRKNRPGTLWGCSCSLESTDDPPTGGDIPARDIPEPEPGLDNDPARDGKLFSGTHPYVSEANPGAKKAVKEFVKKHVPKPEEFESRKYKSGGELQEPKEGKQNKNEGKKNRKAYEELAKLHGERYRLLPVSNERNKKNPDALNLTTGMHSDVKVPTSGNGKNAVQASIKAASKQGVGEVYIFLEREYSMFDIRLALKASFQGGRAKSIKTVIIRTRDGEVKRFYPDKIRAVLNTSGAKNNK